MAVAVGLALTEHKTGRASAASLYQGTFGLGRSFGVLACYQVTISGRISCRSSAETPAELALPFAEAPAGCTEEQRVHSLRCTS
ncbi:hypothetical protein M0804_001266 [Polistes exclamans]|nr:hypothetical protein M0804_001266 [Polistes exclamans]